MFVGWIASTLLLGLLVAIFGTLIAVASFRRAVLRSMNRAAAAQTLTPPSQELSSPPRQALRVCAYSPDTANRHVSLSLLDSAHRRRTQLLAVLLVSGSIQVAISGSLFYFSFVAGPIGVSYVAALLVYATPLAATVGLTLGTSFAGLLIAIAAYLLLLVIAGWVLGRDVIGAWSSTMRLPTLAMMIISVRRLRVAGPVLYVLSVLGIAGASIGFFYSAWVMEATIGTRFAAGAGELAGLTFGQGFQRFTAGLSRDTWAQLLRLIPSRHEWLVVDHPERATWQLLAWHVGAVASLLLVGLILAWLMFYGIAEIYRRRRASDLTIAVDVWWLVFSAVHAMVTFQTMKWRALGFFGAFAAYRMAAALGMRLITRRPEHQRLTLMLLRVFGHDRRSQRLLEQLSSRWRFLGPIRVIAGPDLAYSGMEPHEFFSFMSGRLSREFIRSPSDVAARLRTEDGRPDPDGRYRIEEFFCHEDTWQFAVQRLVTDADVVLMDVRGFSGERRGCALEIRLLLSMVPLSCVVLLVDPSTDIALLDRTAQAAWMELPETSPNRSLAEPELRLFYARESERKTTSGLLELCVAARSPR